MAMSLGTARPRSFARLARPSSTPASHRPLLLCFRRRLYSMELIHDSGSPPTMTTSYLEKLNPQQRRAVEHGGSALAETGPLSTPASHRPLLLCFRRRLYSMELIHDSGSPPTMTTSYLEKLNPQQRRAVEHGGSALAETGPLLIIPGASSGKTNTPAHRVAHLIVNGAD